MGVLYHALALIGAEAQKCSWRNKVCKDKVSLAWMVLRLLAMPYILTDRVLHDALFRSRWSLLYESG